MARSSRARSSASGFLLAAILAVGSAIDLGAHRLDEYLQAARLAIEIDRIELQLELTPGVAVADAILSDLDRDRDGRISAGERSAYVSEITKGVTLEVDGHPLEAHAVASTFPDVAALRTGEGTITVRWAATLPELSAGAHTVFFRNGHRRDVSVYLANALAPVNRRIAITAQRRDADQRALTIAYRVLSATSR